MESEYDRLVNVANLYFGNLSQLSVKLGKSKQLLSTYKKSGKIGRKILMELKEKCFINPEYIQYNTLPMLIPKDGTTIIKEPETPYFIDASKLGLITVYDLPAHANVGSLASFYDLPVSFHPLLVGQTPEKLVGVRVIGESMKDAGIPDGSIALFDPTAEAFNGVIVVAILNGTVLIKRYEIKDGIVILHSAHNGIPPIVCNEIDDKLKILGVYRGTFIYP